MLATDDETGNGIITLSYWRSMQHLHEFARSPVHQAGWKWFERSTKTHPHLSMMHEVYALPKGHWENLYVNFTPFGMGKSTWQISFPRLTEMRVGQIQHLVKPNFDDPGSKTSESIASALVSAKGPRWKTMGSRMGWEGKLE